MKFWKEEGDNCVAVCMCAFCLYLFSFDVWITMLLHLQVQHFNICTHDYGRTIFEMDAHKRNDI